ncbi:MAG: ribonuclease Y [Candidatus Aureabacteria bacterium]|nr:ribonuclease Y [Candidatus Auribacterota bacterium]
MIGFLKEQFLALSIISAAAGLVIGYIIRRYLAEKRLDDATDQAKRLIDEATREANNKKREAEIFAKDELYKSRVEFEKETKNRRKELLNLEARVLQKEESLERKVDLLTKKEQTLARMEQEIHGREGGLDRRQKELDVVLEEERMRLQKVAGLSRDEAKQLLLNKLEDEIRRDAAAMARRIEEEAKETADKQAKKIIALAIQRYGADQVAETTITSVPLPNDEMKGRIIGREGRNIRALEAATGVDIIIDDTPGAVALSGFDPIRKEIARITLERLIADGRIHPARIEEIVEKVKKEMDESIRETGKQAAFDLGIHDLHPELIKLLGRLKFRSSYGQNVLQHSKEVARLVGIMAAELKQDIQVAKRIGLLHDIGKAVDHEVEGAHAVIGADMAKKYNESPEVVHAIAAHHNDVEPTSIQAVLVSAGDAISAARPGARSETLEAYIKRLENLEKIATSVRGVHHAYAIQAGREIRVMVEPDKVNDDEAVVIARTLTKKIQDELEYPGQIKVVVVRETRAVEYAK